MYRKLPRQIRATRVQTDKRGSPALSMKSADFRPGTTENSLEKEDRCAGWRPRIIESAGEPLFRFSRTFDEVGRFPAWNDREFPGKRRPVCRMAAPHHRKCGRTTFTRSVPFCVRIENVPARHP